MCLGHNSDSETGRRNHQLRPLDSFLGVVRVELRAHTRERLFKAVGTLRTHRVGVEVRWLYVLS